jgi:hypothetical protein
MTVKTLHPAGHFWTEFQHIAPVGVALENVTAPAYWQHVMRALPPRSVIHVMAEDNSYEARLRVIGAGGAFKLRVLDYFSTNDQAIPIETAVAPGELEVGFAPAHKWRVIDTVTKDVISKGHTTKEEAEQARDNLISARKAA